MRSIVLIIVIVFAALVIALPFALSACDGGAFCIASTGHGSDAASCPAQHDAHFSLVAQFGTCTPQQSMSWIVVFGLVFAYAALWTVIHRFAQSFLSGHTFQLDARNAPGSFTHMKPFDPLRMAFAFGIIARDETRGT